MNPSRPEPPDQATILRADLLDLLLGPFVGNADWARTKACVRLEHPRRPRSPVCPCGMKRYSV